MKSKLTLFGRALLMFAARRRTSLGRNFADRFRPHCGGCGRHLHPGGCQWHSELRRSSDPGGFGFQPGLDSVQPAKRSALWNSMDTDQQSHSEALGLFGLWHRKRQRLCRHRDFMVRIEAHRRRCSHRLQHRQWTDFDLERIPGEFCDTGFNRDGAGMDRRTAGRRLGQN